MIGFRISSRGDAAEERLKDEQLDDWHSAEAAVLAAEAGIETAAAQLAEAKAKVEKAEADLKAAQSPGADRRGQPPDGQGLRRIRQDPVSL